MSRNRRHAIGTLALTVTAGAVLTLAGCATADPHVRADAALGSDHGLQPSDMAPDFAFTNAEGKASRFSNVRGEVTVVLFPNQPGDWLNPQEYRRLAGLTTKLSGPEVPVVIIDVGRPPRTSDQADAVLDQHPVGADRLVMVADPEGSIRELFGPRAGGRYYVIDNFDRIVAVGAFKGADSLATPVRREVRVVADENPEQHG